MNTSSSLVCALRNSRLDADITLRCQGVDIKAHSLILETRWEKEGNFQLLFYSGPNISRQLWTQMWAQRKRLEKWRSATLMFLRQLSTSCTTSASRTTSICKTSRAFSTWLTSTTWLTWRMQSAHSSGSSWAWTGLIRIWSRLGTQFMAFFGS